MMLESGVVEDGRLYQYTAVVCCISVGVLGGWTAPTDAFVCARVDQWPAILWCVSCVCAWKSSNTLPQRAGESARLFMLACLQDPRLLLVRASQSYPRPPLHLHPLASLSDVMTFASDCGYPIRPWSHEGAERARVEAVPLILTLSPLVPRHGEALLR